MALRAPAARPRRITEANMRTLFSDHAGPRIRYIEGLLVIENLNPQIRTQWVMSRREMFGLAWRCFCAALRA
jgi:hypothetical protein